MLRCSQVEFLFMTNFTLFVPSEIYRQYYSELCNHARNSNCGCTTLQSRKLSMTFVALCPLISVFSPVPDLVLPSFPRETDYINSTQGLVHLPADITGSGKFKSYTPTGSRNASIDITDEGRDRNNSNEVMLPKDAPPSADGGFGGSVDAPGMMSHGVLS